MTPVDTNNNKNNNGGGRNGNDDNGEDKDEIIRALRAKVEAFEQILTAQGGHNLTYYASPRASADNFHAFEDRGMAASHVREIISQAHSCDFNPRLNTAGYINVVLEEEEQQCVVLGSQVNLSDASVYPASLRIHDSVVNMIARLWHAPEPEGNGVNYCGACTVGSTEACLLAGLALKFRWRRWYAARHGLSDEEVMKVRPNVVISSCYQAAWEKFFRYFDVEPRLCFPSLMKDRMVVNARELVELCDEKTIAVIPILGNHYNGAYDPVWDVDAEVSRVNEKNGWQVGIHVDAASGGFVAPFQPEMEEKLFDFRLPNVLSINASGHKFGESVCGTGWVVFRHKEDLGEHVAVSVSYLGGHCDSMTLNFSRPASGVYVQFYKLLRLGKDGFRSKVQNQMKVASFLRNFIRDIKNADGENYFEIMDCGEEACLPVVAARLNPKLNCSYDDIDLQHALAEGHWYISGYHLGFEDPTGKHHGKQLCLCKDATADCTMFRVVVKSNLTRTLAQNLKEDFELTLPVLDSMEDGYRSMHAGRETVKAARHSSIATAHEAARKWSSMRRSSAQEKLIGLDATIMEELAAEDEAVDGKGNGNGATADAGGPKGRRTQGSRRRSVHTVC